MKFKTKCFALLKKSICFINMQKLDTTDRIRKIMSKIPSKDTKPEVLMRKLLHRNGYRFRKNVSSLPGKPDIVLPKFSTVIFVNGCFWHRHDCKNGQRKPKNNAAFWRNKFTANVERDKRNYRLLKEAGWNVIIVWTCKLKKQLTELPPEIELELIRNYYNK